MKLTWHAASGRWTKIIGAKLDKSETRIVQNQEYFTSDYDESAGLAAAVIAEWKQIKRTWKTVHQPHLEQLEKPFPNIPHRYRGGLRTVRGSAVTDATVQGMRETSNVADPNEVAYEHRDATLDEIAALFILDRRQHEGVDYKPQTNKTLESDLSACWRYISVDIVARNLTPGEVDSMRLAMMKDTTITKRAVRNFGAAFGQMIRWYWRSPLFDGGTPHRDFTEEFAKFPPLKNAEPKHLTLATMKTIFDESTPVRRLYLLLMLNTGMAAVDIATVKANAFDLSAGTVKWQRVKNDLLSDPSDVVIVSKLWPETLAAVRKFIARSGYAFRTQDGKPLATVSENRVRHNAITKSLNKLFARLKKLGVEASPKNFRQTGSQLMHEAGDEELAKLWLGRSFSNVDRAYLKTIHSKSNDATAVIHAWLKAEHVL